jgi:hypothetical protein
MIGTIVGIVMTTDPGSLSSCKWEINLLFNVYVIFTFKLVYDVIMIEFKEEKEEKMIIANIALRFHIPACSRYQGILRPVLLSQGLNLYNDLFSMSN